MSLSIQALRKEVERLYTLPTQDLPADAGSVFHELRDLLSAGKVRAALPVEGGWEPQAWIKQGILVGFRLGHVTEIPSGVESPFLDKHNLPLRRLSLADQVRVVPGGSAVRDGAYLGKGVVCIRIHGLKNSDRKISTAGSNPLDFIKHGDSGEQLSSIAKCYTPKGSNSQERYDWIKKHLANAVEEAVKIRDNN